MQHRPVFFRRHGVFFVLAIVGLVVIISSRLLLVTGVPRQATAEPVGGAAVPSVHRPAAVKSGAQEAKATNESTSVPAASH